MADYEIWVSRPNGSRLGVIQYDDLWKMSYTLSANAEGVMTMTVERDALPDSWVTPDMRFDIYRQVPGGSVKHEGDGPWFLEVDTLGMDKSGRRYRRFKAAPAISLINRRCVLYYANSAQAQKTAPADDMMKAIMTENLGSSADASPMVVTYGWPSRRWDSLITIPSNISAGPIVSKGFAWRNVLSTLQDIAKDSAGKGTPLYFDLVQEGTVLAFRIWISVRGTDRTSGANKLVISPERETLGETVELTTDWSSMAAAVAIGGNGQDIQRKLGSAFDSSRVGMSPFGLREQFNDATQLSDPAVLNAEASTRLRGARPLKNLTGTLISGGDAVYGLNWGFCDRFVAEFENQIMTARSDIVTVTVSQGGEDTVTAAIKGET